ncbi:MAG: Mobile element protein, partial [uncultured Rubrobacteraceae bacterium]
EQETHPGTDRAQAARSGRRVGLGRLGPRGREAARHKRGDLPPLEKSVWRHESRCHQAPEGVGEGERPLEEDRRRASCGHKYPKGGEPGKLL